MFEYLVFFLLVIILFKQKKIEDKVSNIDRTLGFLKN